MFSDVQASSKGPVTGQTPVTSEARLAQVNWLNSKMVLSQFAGHRAMLDDDIVTSILLAGVLDANVQHIDRRAETMRLYRAAGSVPDELRRPANFLSIATSVGIPRETARGRLLSQIERGLFHVADNGGVILRSEVLQGPHLAVVGAQLIWAMKDFVEATKASRASGLTQDHELHDPLIECGGIIARLGSAHMLRMIRLVRENYPGLRFPSIVVLLTVNYLTGADLRINAHRTVTPDCLPDPVPVPGPVKGNDVARYVRMPEETVRRHLLALTRRGLLKRTPAGYEIALDDAEALAAWNRYRTGIRVSVDQFIWKLRLGGVIIGPDAP